MYAKYIKRILDFFIALVALVLLFPFMLIIGILIKIDSKGTIFFKQDRLGKNGKVFKIIKFRSMVTNAEKIGDGLRIKSEEDSRITRVGKILRKTSLDELPQLVNVLKGDMSLVGPRPPVPYHPYPYEKYSEEQKKRFNVRPGITGLAQVKGRANIEWQERIKKDIEYVNKITLWGDIKIIFLTIKTIFKKEDIYLKEKLEECESENMKILITATSGPTAIGVMRCLKEKKDIIMYGTDIVKDSIGLKWCKEVFVVKKHTEREEYKKQIKTIIENYNIDLVIPTLQEEISFIKELCEDMKINVATVSGYSIDRLLNKKYIYTDMKEKGLDRFIPEFYIFNNKKELENILNQNFKDETELCIKPVDGHGGKGFYPITKSKENQIKFIKEDKEFFYIDDILKVQEEVNREQIISQYIVGEEISADILRNNGEVVSAVSRICSRVSNGIVIDGKVEYIEEAVNAAKEIVEKFNLQGFLNMQFILNNEGIYLIDLNPRFCGSQIMSLAAGVNFPYLLCQIMRGNSVNKIEPTWGVKIRRYWEAVFYNDKGDII